VDGELKPVQRITDHAKANAAAMKPRILVFVRYYLPGYKAGGPIRTIANLVAHLGDEIEFRIVTSDRDAGDEHSYAGVKVDEWNTVGKADVLYLSPARRSLGTLAKVIRDSRCDALYLNSFFDPDFTIKPLLARRLGMLPSRPVIIAPRGEFSAGALAFKTVKKTSYIGMAKTAGLYSGLVWQASNDHELQDIHDRFGVDRFHVRTVTNLPPHVDDLKSRPAVGLRSRGTPLRICFLSRISPKKNLDFALAVLCRVTVPVRLDIWGPIGDQVHWEQCRAVIGKLPANVSAQYKGSIGHEQVTETIAGYDLFFLPTRGENYGHVILEALTAGTPVLIADTTPWRNLEEHGAGWELPLNSEQAFADKIEWMAGSENTPAMRESARSFADAHLGNGVSIEANRRLFLEAFTRKTDRSAG
jgi:glycosyltransferase involved in cell wall biosynthesis